MLDLTSKEFCDRDLVMTMSRLPVRCAVVLEDVDEQLKSKASHITLAGLLNALDGALATEGRILFMTTNAVEKLDAALIGEGRIDVHVHLGNATADQARRMFLRFFPDRDDAAEVFAAAIPAGTVPPAAIQEHLVARRESADRALADVHVLSTRVVRELRRGAA